MFNSAVPADEAKKNFEAAIKQKDPDTEGGCEVKGTYYFPWKPDFNVQSLDQLKPPTAQMDFSKNNMVVRIIQNKEKQSRVLVRDGKDFSKPVANFFIVDQIQNVPAQDKKPASSVAFSHDINKDGSLGCKYQYFLPTEDFIAKYEEALQQNLSLMK